MERKTFKLLALVMAMIMALSIAPVSALAGDVVEDAAAVGIADNTTDDLAASGSIGDNAFWTFSKETGVLTIVGNGATADFSTTGSPFYAQTAIKSVVITGITKIGNNLFSNCSKIASVSFPDTVTSIGDGAFSYCADLRNITIPDSTYYIGKGVFLGCSSDLTIACYKDSLAYVYAKENGIKVTITIPATGDCGANVKWKFESTSGALTISGTGNMYDFDYDLNESPFTDSGIKSVTVEAGVTGIGACAFANCPELSSVTIADSVKTIGNYAFENCKGLKSIFIPDSVTSIGPETFYGCDDITIGCNYASTAYNYALERNLKLSYGISETGKLGENVIWNYNEATGSVSINGTGEMNDFDLNNVSPFKGNPLIRSVNINSGVENVGDWLFADCVNLEKVTIAENNEKSTRIGKYAFSGCKNLADLTIGNGTKAIGEGAFEECIGLDAVSIPNSVKELGAFAFAFCTSLTEIAIPNGVRNIENNAFYGCTSLDNITIGKKVNHIGKEAFAKTAYEATAANWEDGILYIGAYLISSKPNVEGTITVKTGTECIAEGAFQNRYGVTEFSFPSSLTNIGKDAFKGTDCYDSHWIGFVLYIDGFVIEARPNIGESYEVRGGTKGVADYAFKGCVNLKKLQFNDNGIDDESKIGLGIVDGCPNIELYCYSSNTAVANYARSNKIPCYFLDYNYVIVTFDGNGAKENPAPLKVVKGGTMGENMPIPTKDDYEFLGWYSAKDDGMKYDSDAHIGGDITLYAHWKRLPHKVTKVTAEDVSITYRGSGTIKIALEQEDGAEVKSVTYTPSDTSVVSVDKDGKVTSLKKFGFFTGLSTTVTVNVTDATGKTLTTTCNVNVQLTWWQIIIKAIFLGWIWY